ncbi:MAG: protease FtsH-inhibitory lysogeny factor CIII [Plesiomonas shigelloides]|uniref:Protease FtsH-inhibitory lysogeny factor CIII n=1 Tax=Plesiomonas shigelloides TaxID=703 RepID=A0A8I1W868_PLESH|nr:protease FtsH-inhibitory lysogeny factor CIII [Plesiomonas shigelloides]KAB7698931.1 protease FtsH-inhibitory lysogeny factor CIII [Plesiomonas shigelloides]MBO1109418.1 protease FtsH-inhibitory lysogeny factor CIII [Plesiomonas shigelloides]
MMNYAIAGGTFMGFAPESQLSAIVERIKQAIKNTTRVIKQPCTK